MESNGVGIIYPQTKQYIKREILKLIAKTDDKEHIAGRVTILDIQKVVNELKETTECENK
jgi:hypothetical protein